MSSFHATFKVEGKEFEVLNCVFSFDQNIDDKGRPSSDVHSGKISLEVVSSDDDKLVGWMMDPYKKTDGSIVFEKIDQASTLKTVKFEDGYCTNYAEHFNATSSEPMRTSISISARKITVGGATHEDKWS